MKIIKSPIIRSKQGKLALHGIETMELTDTSTGWPWWSWVLAVLIFIPFALVMLVWQPDYLKKYTFTVTYKSGNVYKGVVINHEEYLKLPKE